jgi:predicted Zn-ribbon and HTH transcriptional regulator
MTKFRCKNCNYRFKTELEKNPARCPNCGESHGITREQSAEELLNDGD